MYFVGLDLGLRNSSLHILDPNGKLFKAKEVRGHWDKVVEEVGRLPRPLKVCFEASCGYGHLYDRLSPLAKQVAVAHPGQLPLIFRSKRKNNESDAAKLAKLLFLDQVPQVHVPGVDVRAWRGLIEFRQKLLRRRVSLKNQLRALLRGLGIEAVKGLWTNKGLAWLEALELAPMDSLRREMMLEDLGQTRKRMRQVEKELEKIAKGHAGVTLLRTIPGVGIRTAEAFLAYLDKPDRFGNLKCVGAYFGLVPCQDATGDSNRLGHITRDGPATARKLLTEAAWQAVRRDESMKAFFERVMREDPQRKKIALVATAHKLARVMAAMLRSGEVYRGTQVTTQATTAGLPDGMKGEKGMKGLARAGHAGPPAPRRSPRRRTDCSEADCFGVE